MNKNILIGVLFIISLLSIGFGLYQKNRADMNETLAIKNEQKAIKLMEDVMKQRKLAEELKIIAEKNAMEARRQEQLARKALNSKQSN